MELACGLLVWAIIEYVPGRSYSLPVKCPSFPQSFVDAILQETFDAVGTII